MNSSVNILVVDDESFMRSLLTEYLEPEGYNVTLAENGEQAWQLLDTSQFSFDVVITDRNMPKMNGLELLRKIKSDTRFKYLPIIFQTALVEHDEVMEGIRAGVYHYLKKPYEPALLLTLVASALAEKCANQSLREASQNQHALLEMLCSGEFHCKTLQQTKQLTPLLAQLCSEPERVVIGLSELLINAIEHGNLGIGYQEKSKLIAQGLWQSEIDRRLKLPEHRNKFVRVRVDRDVGRVRFTITDQGQGFTPNAFLDFDPSRATHSHGRGIAMARLLSFSSIEYLGCGNQVCATIQTQPL